MKCWFINTSYKDHLGYHPQYMTSNFGNLVWNDGCRGGIRYDTQVFLEDIPKIHYSSDDIFVLPLANNFSPGETVFSEKFRCVLSLNARLVAIGIGIQDESIELDDFSAYVGRISEDKKIFSGVFQNIACQWEYEVFILQDVWLRSALQIPR